MKWIFENLVEIALASAVLGIGLLMLVVIYVGITTPRQDSYETVCIQTGGKPVFNGKHWECLK